MRRQDFHFDLPEALIAQHPAIQRAASRLLVMHRDSRPLQDDQFSRLNRYLRAGDLLVFNDTRVIKARLHGFKSTGGRVEVLIERLLDSHRALAQIRSSKSPRPGARIDIAGIGLTVEGRDGEFFMLRAPETMAFDELMESHGHVPLPPYIQRSDADEDIERYQTVYARTPGAVAAPTAGLHFDDELLEGLRHQGVNSCFVTLHVGAGTFQPMRVDDIQTHQMHRERVVVDESVCEAIARTRAAGNRVIAVGTTSVRSLESAWQNDAVRPFEGETDIFIYPGIEVQSIDGLITNFHLPESTLLMLVSAFAGTDATLAAYAHAVRERYRFFSYGDAMLII